MRAIRAAHAFDGSRFLPGGVTLLLDGDRIAGVEAGGHTLPHDVPVTEYPGTVLPGLIDCHSHLVADATIGGLERAGTMVDEELDSVIARSLADQAAGGVTTVRDLGDVRYLTLRHRATPGSPRVVAAGPPITTTAGHCHFLGGAVAGTSDHDLRTAVREHAAAGVDVIKVMASGGFATPGTDQLGAQFTGDQLAVMVAEAHAAGLALVAHAHSLLAIMNALEAGVDGIEHFSGLSNEKGSRIDDAVLDQAARQGTYVDLTLGNDRTLHAYMNAPPPPVAELMSRFGVDSFDAFYQSRVDELVRFREHGVRVVAGVDSGMGPMKRHGNLWRAACDLAEGGYPAAEALAAATSIAAEACGLGGGTGRLAPGLAADLLVVDGDLANGMSLLSSPRLVLLRGQAATSPEPAPG